MKKLRDGEPCSHKGCLNHISHPCERCSRIAGRNETRVLECDFGINSCVNNKDGFCTVEENIKEGKTCVEVIAWINPY